MYSNIKLNLYCDNWDNISQNIKKIIINNNLSLKELHNSTLLFSAIKNPENVIIAVVSNINLLNKLEAFAKTCHNYQNRIFIVFKDTLLDDNFFTNSCHHTQIDTLNQFLQSSIITGLQKPFQPSKLLLKLIAFELDKLQLSTKYTGFKYLTQLSANYLCNTFPPNAYIDLFGYVSNLNFASIDTIERDVRHMLVTTWKNNLHFRNKLLDYTSCEKPNSKNILNALLQYLKNRI